jgi:hypothetical protein
VYPKLGFREAGMQVSPVTMSHPSPRSSAPPCLPLPLKKGLRLFCFLPLAFALEHFLGFGFCFGCFSLGSFWKGKELLKEKELLKGNY